MATLRRGLQDELALYGAVTRPIGEIALQGGLRGTFRRQDNTGWAEETDAGWNGFAGAVAMLGQHLLLSTEGDGIRFPNLSERFFTGTTGRGGIIGNPDLDPEHSVSVDLGGTVLGEQLADEPAHRIELALQRRFSRLECEAAYQYRFEKDDPGPGEQPIGDAHLVTLRARQALSSGFSATLSVANLLDEQYFAAADSRAPPAPGRSVALSISFND
jgi:outer membrane receptor protein involved in Fe transport